MSPKILIAVSVLFLFVSCKKEKLEKTDSAYLLMGHWKHFTSQTNYHYLNIESSYGEISEYSNGVENTISEAKSWFLKDNELLLGRFPNKEEKFVIDTFPQNATQNFAVGYDTILVGNRFMYLDGKIYHE